MSRKEPIEIEFKSKKISPEFIYETVVVPFGNGAIIRSYKKFLGKKVIIIINEDEGDTMKTKKQLKKLEKQEKKLYEDTKKLVEKTNIFMTAD